MFYRDNNSMEIRVAIVFFLLACGSFSYAEIPNARFHMGINSMGMQLGFEKHVKENLSVSGEFKGLVGSILPITVNYYFGKQDRLRLSAGAALFVVVDCCADNDKRDWKPGGGMSYDFPKLLRN